MVIRSIVIVLLACSAALAQAPQPQSTAVTAYVMSITPGYGTFYDAATTYGPRDIGGQMKATCNVTYRAWYEYTAYNDNYLYHPEKVETIGLEAVPTTIT